MKKLFILAATASLAACGGGAEETDMSNVDDTMGDTAVTDTAAPGQMAGTYESTADDGTVTMQQVNADGTYVDTVDGEETERGTWRQQGDQLCYDPDGEMGETCYTGSEPGSDGSFTVTGENGETMTVRKTG